MTVQRTGRLASVSIAGKEFPVPAGMILQIVKLLRPDHGFTNERMAGRRNRVLDTTIGTVPLIAVILVGQINGRPGRIRVVAAGLGVPEDAVQRVLVGFVDLVQWQAERNLGPVTLARIPDLR